MLKIFQEWGFSRQGWRNGERGEYLVLLQFALMIGFVLLPVYRPVGWVIDSPLFLSLRWGIATVLGLAASIFIGKGLLDLGRNLTPLPYPKEHGQLVQSGIYSIVRHPLYTGLIAVALSWSVFHVSLSHLLATAILFTFFDAKSGREEAWLTQKYSDYAEYQQQVKKLIPGFY
jgi:protein-S-isoprenylcysteine O-methyltransferase Ste14